jgi:hypothetical protein
MMLIFLDSKTSSIKIIQEKFWKKVHGVSFDENTAESIVKNLSDNNIRHEVVKFPYFTYIDKLENIKKDRFVSLSIPFMFRNKRVNKKTAEEIISYSKSFEKNKKVANKAFAIIIKAQTHL